MPTDAKAQPPSPLLFRSILLCNGLRPDHMRKAAGSAADVVMLELEDGVPLEKKDEARANVVTALTELNWGATSRFVRVENPNQGLLETDLAAVVPARPTGIVVAKTSGPGDITRVEEAISRVESEHHITKGHTRIGAMIEAAAGFFNVEAIASASKRMSHLSCGEGDLQMALGYRHLPATEPQPANQPYLLYLRSRVIFAAHAAGIAAVTPGSGANLADDLMAHYRFLYQLGFDGVSVGTPKKAEFANNAFSPSKDEIEFSRHAIAEFERGRNTGLAVIPQSDGSWIGEVHVGPAQRVLDRLALIQARQLERDRPGQSALLAKTD